MLKKRNKKGKYLCSKTVDVAIASVCIVILFYHILVCLEKYLSKRTRVISELKPSHLEVLPSYTFCPGFTNFSYKDSVFEAYNTSRLRFVYNGDFFNNGTDPIRVYREATHELSELISNITIECLATPSSNGRCYEMRINSSKIHSPIISVTINGKASFYVYLHFPGQFGYINSASKIPINLSDKLYNRYYKLKQIVLCGPPCSTLDIFSGMPHRSVHKDPHQSYMKLYMKTTIRVKTSIIDYSADTMLGEIGGSTGLLLGISLMKSGIKIKRWIMGNEDE
ncbi:unnamed protein product [Lepeophtheirus salmonis]|uniref:(salmon louse) hypothetical protein n=1 Tax=Lepeophtheirus salmonis TaxID=72036 RepID=A0A7R8CGF9_LEPSM|nr:unnamed protein product [Lepeophtheirus salmonis]CAF2775676.1 unnamed protein product [Lepeophtheirus salmonis]